jgi:UDPglucose 6-dehydrogenase
MKLGVVGSGYVGTTITACFSDLGHAVTAVDVDDATVAEINRGSSPIHELGLADLLAEHADTSLRATTEYEALLGTDVVFVALPTPTDSNGQIDTSVVEAGIESIARTFDGCEDAPLVVIKSTVVPRTTERVFRPPLETVDAQIRVAVNPEFLREGRAVDDFFSPGQNRLQGRQRGALRYSLGRLHAAPGEEPRGDSYRQDGDPGGRDDKVRQQRFPRV